ncbi:phage tail protein [Siccibacter colletis]|uniref:phage tail protein n=1 Tax=Siccibacter colletis TaxID=1505757 RepID=UPI0004E18B5B|nr:phage tail protein [Siccibacter colletis]
MTAKYFAILTNQGAARLANATALGTRLNLTQLAVGDANGVLPMPNPAQTALIHEQRRAPLNLIDVDPANPGQIIVEQIIPEDEGGFWIREIGLYDDEGFLVAVANCPETYKPKLQEGSGRTQTIRMVLIVSSTEAVTLKIDPAVVLATRKYVDDKVIEVKAYADGLLKKHVEAANPHPQYPLIANALKEMADAGLVGEVLKNLGLGEGSALPVGVPVPWPSATAPAGWLKYNGAAFDKARYPKLAAVYPSGVLPDLRGEFIRGWDDGRGVDAGRGLLTSQAFALQNIIGSFCSRASSMTGGGAITEASGVFSVAKQSGPNYVQMAGSSSSSGADVTTYDASRVANTSSETRPRNIAFNYIVRAA